MATSSATKGQQELPALAGRHLPLLTRGWVRRMSLPPHKRVVLRMPPPLGESSGRGKMLLPPSTGSLGERCGRDQHSPPFPLSREGQGEDSPDPSSGPQAGPPPNPHESPPSTSARGRGWQYSPLGLGHVAPTQSPSTDAGHNPLHPEEVESDQASHPILKTSTRSHT